MAKADGIEPVEAVACAGGGADLVWFGAAGTRTKKEITAFGILDNFDGTLVRDDFGGYVSYDDDLEGVQQCLSHMLRHLQDVIDIDPLTQACAVQATDAPRLAIHAFNLAGRKGAALDMDTDAIAKARKKFDQAVACGISINLSRPRIRPRCLSPQPATPDCLRGSR